MASPALCTTPACLQASSQLLSQLHPSWEKMDPCSDFDKMVCHRFSDLNPPNTGTLEQIGAVNNRVIHGILESTYQGAVNYQAIKWNNTFTSNAVDEANFNKLQRDYKACMNTEAIEKAGTKPLVDLIASLHSIWPINTKDGKAKMTQSDYDGLSNAIYFLQELGIETFQKIEVGTFLYDTNLQAISLEGPAKFRSQNVSLYEDPEGLKIYAQATSRLLLKGYFPGNISEEAAESIAAGVAVFEADMVKAKALATADNTGPFDLRRAGQFTLQELSKWYSIDKALKALIPANYPANKTVFVNPTDYFANLTEILASHPKTVVQSYLVLRALDALEPAVDSTVTGVARWGICLQQLDSSQMYVLGRFFVGATYPDSLRRFMDNLATNLRNQMKVRIGELEWMSSDAKARAIKKTEEMVQNVGYPETESLNTRKPESLEAYYKRLNITDDFFANVLAGRRHRTAKAFEGLLKPNDRHLLGAGQFPPQTLNAFYNTYDNTIHLLAGITQRPIISDEIPGYASYGALGAVTGHEIMHGFDSNGRLVNEKQQLATWWDNATVTEYNRRAQCFVKQYSSYEYPIPGGKTAKTDGELTLAENLSDAGGLRLAYDAWKKTQASKKDADLPGLQMFSHDQLFFIFFANLWCNSFTPEHNLVSWPADNHSHGSHRIKGGVANSRAFRQAFQCKVKEPECEIF